MNKVRRVVLVVRGKGILRCERARRELWISL